MKRFVASAAILVALFSGVAAAQLSPLEQEQKPAADKPAPPSNALNKSDLEFYVRHLYVYGDQINISVADYKPSELPGMLKTTVTASYKLASKEHVFYVSEDGKKIVEGTVYTVDENPFQETIQTIDTTDAPAFGKEGASVVVVAYSDFQCPYCAQEAKILREQLKREYENRVRVYFKDFPLGIHDWAKEAAVIGRCIHAQEPEAFRAYHDWIFENQGSITSDNLKDKAVEQAAANGVDRMKLAACLNDGEMAQKVEASLDEGRAVGVTSTPTLFVNGRKLSGSYKWEQIKGIIDYELEYQEVTGNAGDDCGCAIELDFPQ